MLCLRPGQGCHDSDREVLVISTKLNPYLLSIHNYLTFRRGELCSSVNKYQIPFKKFTYKKKETFWALPERSHVFSVKVQSVSRVLSWTVIFLRQSLPKGSSEYVEMPSRHLVSVLAPSGVYMHALSPKRVWALTPHFHPYNLRCGIFLLHFP